MKNYHKLDQKVLAMISEELKKADPNFDPFVAIPKLTLLEALTHALHWEWLLEPPDVLMTQEEAAQGKLTAGYMAEWVTRKGHDRHMTLVLRYYAQIAAACKGDNDEPNQSLPTEDGE